ncbi:MAG: GUN4 domain-containing protein [Stenomitos rutilans HA7619-LM2]|nr:GUN4 domain-containing protein [Stenomitos rutilans HA7619-LM2]
MWVNNSDGKFGFSVQKKIYVGSCGGELSGQNSEKADNCFGDRVGWRVKENWISNSDTDYSTQAPRGHLPTYYSAGGTYVLFWEMGRFALFSRAETCKL